MTDEAKKDVDVSETDNFVVVNDEAVDAGITKQSEKTKHSQDKNEEGGESADTKRQDDKSDQEEKENHDDNNANNAGEETGQRRGHARFQKRIDRLTKRAAEAERRAKELEHKLQEVADNNGGQEKPETKDDDDPDPSDFDNYDDYLDALADWKADKKIGKKEGKNGDKAAADEGADKGDKGENPNEQEQEDNELTEAIEDIQDAFNETRKKYSDFDRVIGSEDLHITKNMVIVMVDTDDPGAIAYHLGKNKREAERIAKLSPIAQAREIGKIEEKLSSAAQRQPVKKTTDAPAPIDPVKGSDSSKKSPQDMDFAEYEQTQNEKERGSRGFW